MHNLVLMNFIANLVPFGLRYIACSKMMATNKRSCRY